MLTVIIVIALILILRSTLQGWGGAAWNTAPAPMVRTRVGRKVAKP